MGFRAEAQWYPAGAAESAATYRTGDVFMGWTSGTPPTFPYLTSSSIPRQLVLSSSKSLFFGNDNGYTAFRGNANTSTTGSISHNLYGADNSLWGGYSFSYNANPPSSLNYKRIFSFSGGAALITNTNANSSAETALTIKAGDVSDQTGGTLALLGGKSSDGTGGTVVISGGTSGNGANGKVIIGQKGITEIGGIGGTINIMSALLKVNGTAGTEGSALGTNSNGAPAWLDVPNFTAPIDPGFVPKKMSLLSGNAFEQSQIFEDESSLNVGIGSVAPSSKLHIGTTTTTNGDVPLLKLSHFWGGSGSLKEPTIVMDNGETANLTSWKIGAGVVATGQPYFRVRFKQPAMATEDEYFRINGDGKVGIGTSAPSSKIGVHGNESIGTGYSAVEAPANGLIVEGNTGIGTPTPESKIAIHGNGSIGTAYSSIAAPANGLIVEGRLGIGSSAPLGHLQIRSNLTFRDDAVSSEVGRNWYYNGTTQTKIFDEPSDVTHGSGKLQIGSDGRFNFYNASMDQSLTSLEANTPKLTILNSGKIGIGTTNPQAQLEVLNDIKITKPNASGISRAKLVVGNFKPDDAIWDYDNIAIAADGHVFCTELIVLNPTNWVNWPDYVFSKDYKLASLDSVEKFVLKHNHLPEIPSQPEVRQKGVALEAMNQALLKKVEELTLYVIQLNKEVQALKSGK